INKPSVLLADEPTGSVDQETAAQILKLLRDLNREGQTIVMVTHDSTVAAAASQLITMRDGRRTDQPEPGRAAQAN
ncbi:MAG: ABC-type antimicrobial peptide transport system, ATPase component, partial [Symbiobacteriaceae bacterium]|nr:ABC-type antimicrobial peptide transport system, ATPase component [Symbiobacteriaceae bacterium]